VPDVPGLVVVLIDGGIQAVGLQAHPFGAGEKFPGPGDGLVLEVIAEGEVAQHLEIGAVAVGLADVLDVGVRMHFWQVVTGGGEAPPRW
jgi:hypothetical protein